jgi:hypothetical protein
VNTVTSVDQDPVRAFRHALGRDLNTRLNTTQTVVALIHAAVTNHRWTPKQLADECGRDLADVISAGAVITERLRKAAQHPPVGHGHNTQLGPKRPFCTAECRDNAGWVLDDDRNPIRRCACRTEVMS